MKLKLFTLIMIGLMLGSVMAQEESITSGLEKDDSKDLKPGDIAPSWALMYAPGKFEFLRTWSEEEGKKLRLIVSQPDRHTVLMSFFATWCKP